MTAEGLPSKGGLPRSTTGNAFQKSALQRLVYGASRTLDSLDVIVFRVSFTDRSFTAEHDSIYFENELRHLREYYLGASRNIFNLKTELAPGVVSLSGAEAYYGEDALWTERMAEILIQIVQETDSHIDFSRYDAVAFIHAGAGQETDFSGDSSWQLWSGFMSPQEMKEALKDTLGMPGVPTNDTVHGDSLYIDNLMIWPEEASQDSYTLGSLGIYAYELGLRLGMVPLQDTTPDGYPDSQGIGQFDLMGYGIYNGAFMTKKGEILLSLVPAFPCAFNRYLMGWAEPVVVEADCTARIADINAAAEDTVLIKIPINASEYYLVENRIHDTNINGVFDFIDVREDLIDYVGNPIPANEDTLRGAEFDFFLTETTDIPVSGDSLRVTGGGLMIYHVDESVIRRAIESGGYPNDVAEWKGVDVEEADGIQDLDSRGGTFAYGSFYDSFRKGNHDRFGTDTNPSSLTNGGAKTGIEIDSISSAGHFMTFRARFSPPMETQRGEFAGDAGRLSPIPADIHRDGVEELVIAADTGLIYVASNAASYSWNGEVDGIVSLPGVLWSGAPVLADVDHDGVNEIFIASRDGTLHAFRPTGEPYVIDTDGTPGSLKLPGDRASAPIALELDGDPGDEIVVFSSTTDSTFVCFIGFSLTWPDGYHVHKIGSDGITMNVKPGVLASHPALGVLHEQAAEVQGLYFVTSDPGNGLQFNYLRLTENGLFVGWAGECVSDSSQFKEAVEGLMTIASGDVDRDGSDELVAVVPPRGSGRGEREILYWAPSGSMHFAPVRGSNVSPPVLADANGDGTLETAMRDDSYLYLLAGYGAPVSGWPKELDAAVVERDRGESPAAPVIGDINGDGRIEVVFRVAGDLHAFDYRGEKVAGWPLPGEGTPGASPALLKGEDEGLFIFDCASFLPYAVDSSLGGEAKGVVSSVRRYDPQCPFPEGQVWPCYRHDAGGSARQMQSAGASPVGTRIDPASFIVYPNPATGSYVTVRVLISAPAEVKLDVLNIEGEKVLERRRGHAWFEGSTVPFEETVRTDRFSSGVYIARLEVSGSGWSWSGSKKFAVIR